MKKVCIITGTRAEWGLLTRLAGLIQSSAELELQVVATNMHLSERYGLTYKEIEADGFTIDYPVPMEAAGDTAGDTVRAMGAAMAGFAEAYEALHPDMLVVLGDRYEILAAVSAALIFNIPVAHLHGGETTEGAFDDAIRHAITKMSHLHFTSTEAYRQRVVQMGEQPDRVFNVGAMGVENIKKIPLWSQEQTEQHLGGFALDRNTVLATYHPVTLEHNTAEAQIEALLGALDRLPTVRVLFTMPNSDTGNHVIGQKVEQWCAAHSERAVWFTSLGLKRYLSVLQYIGAVVGNSSSGIIEVPSFGIPTLDIGDRQKGRIAAESVVHCAPDTEAIYENLLQIVGKSPIFVSNPYDQPETAAKIVSAIAATDLGRLTTKRFYNQKQRPKEI